MKKFLKFMLGVGGCLFYYIIVCVLLDIDIFDPWEKVMKWVKGEKDEVVVSEEDNNEFYEDME